MNIEYITVRKEYAWGNTTEEVSLGASIDPDNEDPATCVAQLQIMCLDLLMNRVDRIRKAEAADTSLRLMTLQDNIDDDTGEWETSKTKEGGSVIQ